MLGRWLSVELSTAARALYPFIKLGERWRRRNSVLYCFLLVDDVSKLVAFHLPFWNGL